MCIRNYIYRERKREREKETCTVLTFKIRFAGCVCVCTCTHTHMHTRAIYGWKVTIQICRVCVYTCSVRVYMAVACNRVSVSSPVTHTYMYACIHIFMHMHICIYVYIYIHTYRHRNIYMYIYTEREREADIVVTCIRVPVHQKFLFGCYNFLLGRQCVVISYQGVSVSQQLPIRASMCRNFLSGCQRVTTTSC